MFKNATVLIETGPADSTNDTNPLIINFVSKLVELSVIQN